MVLEWGCLNTNSVSSFPIFSKTLETDERQGGMKKLHVFLDNQRKEIVHSMEWFSLIIRIYLRLFVIVIPRNPQVVMWEGFRNHETNCLYDTLHFRTKNRPSNHLVATFFCSVPIYTVEHGTEWWMDGLSLYSRTRDDTMKKEHWSHERIEKVNIDYLLARIASLWAYSPPPNGGKDRFMS